MATIWQHMALRVPAIVYCMHSSVAPWPSLDTLLAVDNTRPYDVGRRLRLAWVIRRTRALRSAVDESVARCPWLRPTLRDHPVIFRPLISGFLDSRLGPAERFKSFSYDLEFTSTLIQSALPDFFPASLAVRLWQYRDYSLDLAMNLDHPQEGLWRLSLRCSAHPALFSLCFSIVPGPTLFVGSVQGARSSDTSSAAHSIRTATKEFHGLRPHFLLFEALRTVACIWRVRKIEGTATDTQLKSRSRANTARAVKFPYDHYFEELGAKRAHNGNWNVPLVNFSRAVADAPSRKRAMYRRRNELRAKCYADVSTHIRGLGPFLAR